MFFEKTFYKTKSSLTNFEFRLLSKRASRHGYRLVSKTPVPRNEIVVDNYFGTAYQKNALISYLVDPFIGPLQRYHSNHQECKGMAEILSELGFNVDIISWDNQKFLPRKSYQLVIDNHNNLFRLANFFNGNTLKIFHATNAHWLYQNWLEYGRYYELYQKSGLAITPPRQMIPGNSIQECDAVSMFGNEFTRNTFGKYKDKVFHLPMSVTAKVEVIANKNFALAKNKFVWLNSHGALLKGLDVIIETFSKLPHCELCICYHVPQSDQDYFDIISSKLRAASNIKFAGWVDIDGEKFREISVTHAWAIGSSFSEGGGGSVLNCMAKGLIPVISDTTSITLPPDTGFVVAENTVSAWTALISKLVRLPEDRLAELSKNATDFVSANHTLESFKKQYKEFLFSLLNCRKN